MDERHPFHLEVEVEVEMDKDVSRMHGLLMDVTQSTRGQGKD
jgi:hypothetical protein